MSDNQIVLTPAFVQEENIGSGTIYPGMLLEKTSTPKVKAHATEGGFCERAFAFEDAYQGKTKSDAYSDGVRVFYAIVPAGGRVLALLEAGQNVAIGAQLISAGNGKLKAKADAGSGVTVEDVVASAEEALDLSGSGAVDTLLAVRVW